MFEKDKFLTGVNYWASHAATEMWSKWDADVVDRDFSELEKYGVSMLRVFPLWPDFQPLKSISCAGQCVPFDLRREGSEERFPDTEAGRAGVDETMMERFETLCDLAEKHHMKLIVCILTAHMTFRLYVPHAFEGRDLYLDPKALKWEGKFYRYFVRRMKHHPAIAAWESGNESNLISATQNEDTAWFWQNYVYSIIRNEDTSRPIIAVSDQMIDNNAWLIKDGAELGDVVAVHPYSMWGNGGIEEFNHIRNIMFSTSLNRITQDIAGCECFIEEIGCQREIATDTAHIGSAARNILWNSWRENSHALLWWCAFDQTEFDIAPYGWGNPALEHGILKENYEPHPIALEMQKFNHFLKTLPFSALPEVKRDGVCLTNDMEIAQSAFILSRQAGVNLKFAASQEQKLSEADFYMLPSAAKRGALSTQMWKALQEKVHNGATLYLSLNDTYLDHLEDICGVSVVARRVARGTVDVMLDDRRMTLPQEISRKMKLAGAEILATDAEGNGVFFRHKFGKGTVYTLNFALEKLLYSTPGYFEAGAWKFYKKMFNKAYLAETDDAAVTATEHFFSEKSAAVAITNSGMNEAATAVTIAPGWKVTEVYGDGTFSNSTITLPENSGCILLLGK